MTTSTDIKEIAGKWLGKTMAGESMTPYEAPKKHDASLLVPIPRKIGREKSNIDSIFFGYDVWHAYEFSFLHNGQPLTGVLKFVFPHNTENMIESKSFKLYLNSFDFESFESVSEPIQIIREDLSRVAGGNVAVTAHRAGIIKTFSNTDLIDFLTKAGDASIDYKPIDNISFDESINHLTKLDKGDEFNWYSNTVQYFHTANLRSACEITNQKDTGHAIIAMLSDYKLDSDEVARFIFSMRDAQHFHENVTEIMYDKLYKHYNPQELLVMNIYNRRGGLDIHPARSSSKLFINYVGAQQYFNSGEYRILTNQV